MCYTIIINFPILYSAPQQKKLVPIASSVLEALHINMSSFVESDFSSKSHRRTIDLTPPPDLAVRDRRPVCLNKSSLPTKSNYSIFFTLLLFVQMKVANS